MNFQTGLMMLWTVGLNGTLEIFITEINFLDLNDDVINQKVFHRDFTFTKHGIIIGGDYRTWNVYIKWRELKKNFKNVPPNHNGLIKEPTTSLRNTFIIISLSLTNASRGSFLSTFAGNCLPHKMLFILFLSSMSGSKLLISKACTQTVIQPTNASGCKSKQKKLGKATFHPLKWRIKDLKASVQPS